jgi:FHA domain
VDADFDDTVIAPARAERIPKNVDFDDTIIRGRATVSDQSPVPLIAPEAAHATAERDATRFYAFRIGRNPVVSLDAPVYIGRRPSLPRVISGQVPILVGVSSPLGEVSSTHVELRQIGVTVVVTDLKSTNGTVIGIPGQVPRTLRQGESAVVTPGTLVDIGDRNVIEILSLRDVPDVRNDG